MACHCEQCQRWAGGSPLFSVSAKSDVSVTGEVATYRASTWGERAFCRICGTTLWWKMQGGAITGVAPGLFAGQDAFNTVSKEIFVDHRASWQAPVDGASQSTEAQEQAKLEAYLRDQGK